MKSLRALLLGSALCAPLGLVPVTPARAVTAPGPYQHVLLISIDGMHAVDLSAWFHYAHFGVGTDPLRTLSLTGTVFMNAYTSAPSDSFPGMIALVTGATPKSSGVYYDDGYDRKMYAPGSNCAGNPGTETNYSEFIDKDSTRLDAGGTPGGPSANTLTQIDMAKLPMQFVPMHGKPTCVPVLPHQFLRVNTVFEQIHAQLPGAVTAWSDKHPSYEILNGPSGTGIDDMYALEVNAIANTTAGTDYTQSYLDTQKYDAMKVQAVINQINGMDSTGTKAQAVPVLFGMNFQSVSVGQKLATSGPDDIAGLVGGYKTASPTGAQNGQCKLPGFWNSALTSLQPSCPGGVPQLGQINFVDQEIGLMVDALTKQNLLNSTLIIISAKHGQSPIDPKLVSRVNGQPLFQQYANPAFGVYDDVGLIWLDPTRTLAQYKTVQHTLAGKNKILHQQTLLANTDLVSNYNSPFGDSRTPDFISLPIPGTIYTTGTKIAEHGGFTDDDRIVALMISAPNLPAVTNAQPVETRQIAPTIMKALGLDYTKLDAYAAEGTQPLPINLP